MRSGQSQRHHGQPARCRAALSSRLEPELKLRPTRIPNRSTLTPASGRRQNVARMPPLMARPSSGAQASTVHRPSTPRDGRSNESQRRLPHVGDVLGVDEQAPTAEPPLAQQADDDVGTRHRAVGIHLEPLLARVVDLEADAAGVLALPHADQSGAVTRCQRRVDEPANVVLARSHVGIGGGARPASRGARWPAVRRRRWSSTRRG